MSEWGEYGAQQGHADEERDTPATGQEGGERIASAFQGSEAHAGGGAQNQSIELLAMASMPNDDQNADDLGEFFDQSDHERAAEVKLSDKHRLEHRRGKDSQKATIQKRQRGGRQRQSAQMAALVQEGDVAHRNEEVAEQEHRGKQVGVAGQHQHADPQCIQQQADEQDPPPGAGRAPPRTRGFDDARSEQLRLGGNRWRRGHG